MYAMAGLRLGYLLSSDNSLHKKMSAIAQCWSVSGPAQIAGVAALSCEGWQAKTRNLVAQERHFLLESLKTLGITVFPSDCNFILLRSERPLYGPLLKEGILIRRCGNFIGLDDSYYRIGIRQHSDNVSFVHAVGAAIGRP